MSLQEYLDAVNAVLKANNQGAVNPFVEFIMTRTNFDIGISPKQCAMYILRTRRVREQVDG